MSLHIQMSEEAEAELQRTARRNKISSMSVCLAFLLLGGAALYFAVNYIMQDPPAVFVAYTPPAENLPPTNQPTQQELTSKAASPSSDVAPSVIVSTAAAPVAMAAVEVDTSDASFGTGLDVGMGFGTGGIGDGLGTGGNGLGSGTAGGSTLEGTFYDLKLTRAGAATDIRLQGDQLTNDSRTKVTQVLSEFTKNWQASVLDKYYKSPTKLYASNFYLPSCKAAYAPIAYQCKDKCKPSGWVAVYRGKVTAPKSGKFRFVGTGDDVLCVRFNRKNVLEAGWAIPSLFDTLGGKAHTAGALSTGHGQAYHKAIKAGTDANHKDYKMVKLPECSKWNNEIGGLTAGTIFEVKEGQKYPIEILVSEIPGGAFGFALLIEDLSDEYKEGRHSAKYDLFRTNLSTPNKAELEKLLREAGCMMGGLQCPNYNEDSPVWVATP